LPVATLGETLGDNDIDGDRLGDFEGDKLGDSEGDKDSEGLLLGLRLGD
jgi:hypothetical protein